MFSSSRLLAVRARAANSNALRSYHHVAIVGTGSSAFYTAKYCLDINSDVRVDMFEKLPTPYGLVRFGVAPDHPEVKTVEETFTQVAESGRVRLFANVEVGDRNDSTPDLISIEDLQRSYSALVFAYGASSDMALRVPGEDLGGVISSRSFVNWYNGHPDFADLHKSAYDLSKVEHVVVVGQGNVALDCARVLTKPADELQTTDISTAAMEALRNSKVKTVTVLGRRGHIQSAFTIKEFRELTRIPGVRVAIDSAELEMGRTEASMQELEGNRPKKRIVDLIESTCTAAAGDSKIDKTIIVKYLSTPTEIVGHSDSQRVKELRIVRNTLTGPAGKQKATPAADTEATSLPCDLLIKAVGYRCESISASFPFSGTTHTIPSRKGRVLSITSDDPRPGMYVTGWLKRGATGIIASNIPDAKETAAAIAEDLRSGVLQQVDDSLLKDSALVSLLPHYRYYWS
jgi:adrenodoxin-NADP+ reductase